MKGIDISNFQGTVNGKQIKEDGYEAVYIMATEGVNFTSPTLEAQYNQCSSAGLYVGFYHFMLPSDNGTAQAQHFYNQTKNFKMQCKIALDCETKNGYSQAQITQVAEDFANEIERLFGTEIIIYASPYWANANLGSSLSKYGYWEADYTYDLSKAPAPTNNWGNSNVGWQWSNKGRVNGCPEGNTDLDVFTDKILLNGSATINTFTPIAGTPNFKGLNGVSLKPVKKVAPTPTPTPIPTPTPTPVPTPSGNIVVGSTVEITGGVYGGQGTGTGTTIGSDYLNQPYQVQQINGNQALIKQLESWVYISDLRLVSGGGSTPAPTGSIEVGSWVEVTGSVFAGNSQGVAIPSNIRYQVYKVIQMNQNGTEVLLGAERGNVSAGSLLSWVSIGGVKLISNSSNGYAELFMQPTYRINQRVKIIGNTYSTGQTIPDWAKNVPYTIQQVDTVDKKVLINELQSWVNYSGIVAC